MAILVDSNTKVICQGITGAQGTFHTEQAIAYGTKMVGGVTPGKGGSTHLGLPVFDTVHDAVKDGRQRYRDLRPASVRCGCHSRSHRRRNPADRDHHRGHPGHGYGEGQARARRLQVAADRAELPRGHHTRRVQDRHHAWHIHKRGSVGIVSRSGTLTYEAVHQTTMAGLGQTTCIGIGGDPVKGTEHIDVLEMLLADDETQSIVMIGEIGGSAEEEAAAFYKSSPRKKPIVGFIAGVTGASRPENGSRWCDHCGR